MARAPKEPTSTLNLPVSSAVALEMMLATLISLLLVELARLAGPVGWVFGQCARSRRATAHPHCRSEGPDMEPGMCSCIYGE